MKTATSQVMEKQAGPVTINKQDAPTELIHLQYKSGYKQDAPTEQPCFYIFQKHCYQQTSSVGAHRL